MERGRAISRAPTMLAFHRAGASMGGVRRIQRPSSSTISTGQIPMPSGMDGARSSYIPCTDDACIPSSGCVNGRGEANPTTVFFDDFNRPDSNAVGNGWSEVELYPVHRRCLHSIERVRQWEG